MKTKEEIKEILERNLGIKNGIGRINIFALSEIVEKRKDNCIRDLWKMMKDLYERGYRDINDIIYISDLESIEARTILANIDPKLLVEQNLNKNKNGAMVIYENNQYYLNEIICGTMMSKYDTIYAVMVQETIRRLVQEFKDIGINITKLEDLSVKTIMLKNIKTFIKSSKEVWAENYRKALISGENPYIDNDSNAEQQWLEVKENILYGILDGINRMNVTFNLNIDDDVNDLLWDKDC